MPDIDSGYEMIRKVAAREVEKLHLLEYGKVESVNIHGSEDDGIGYTCSVLLVGRTTDDGEMLKLENIPIVAGFMGQIDVPGINDLVLISYINGDFELPVIIGRLYSKEKTPPLFEDGQHLWEISKSTYESDLEKSVIDIKFVDGSNTKIHITDSSLEVATGKLRATISSGDEPYMEFDANGTTVTIKEDGNINIAAKANIMIKSDADINLEASGNVNIKGSKINLN